MKLIFLIISSLLVEYLSYLHGTETTSSIILNENRRSGSKEWWFPQNGDVQVVVGFTTQFSFYPTDTVQFKMQCNMTVTGLEKYDLNIFRLGYYGGLGGRKIDTIRAIQCGKQPECIFEPSSRMTDCANWEISLEWSIPNDVVTGVYVALPVVQRPSRSDTGSASMYYGNHIPFVVKQSLTQARSKGSDLLFKTADLTWVAYNTFGGWNYYRGNGSKLPSTRAYKASYNRPFTNRRYYPVGQHENFIFGTELPFIYWLEKYGYDVSYMSCADVENILVSTEQANTVSQSQSKNYVVDVAKYKVLLSIGHDEYWSPGLVDAFVNARKHCVHLAFFSGNEVFWRILWSSKDTSTDKFLRQSPSINTDKNRIIVCHKETIDNVSPSSSKSSLWTGTFMDPRHRPENDYEAQNALTGQLLTVNSFRRDSLEITRYHAGLRFWRDTAFYNSESLHREKLFGPTTYTSTTKAYSTERGILGYEWDAFVDDCNRPDGLFTLSKSVYNVNGHMMENYGQTYKGNATATHSLTLYRHYEIGSEIKSKQRLKKYVCLEGSRFIMSPFRSKQFGRAAINANSSLVFGAGTVQWAWALSELHDGMNFTADYNIQQATMNLFADMNILPEESTFEGTSDGLIKKSLVFPTINTDSSPPKSMITINLKERGYQYMSDYEKKEKCKSAAKSYNITKGTYINIKGTSKDNGGGNVAAVEVSLDGGRHWHLAQMLDNARWTLRYPFKFSTMATKCKQSRLKELDKGHLEYLNGFKLHDVGILDKIYDEGKVYFDQSSGNKTLHLYLLILSRAVDDSGWREAIDYEQYLNALCDISLGEGCAPH